MGLVAQGNFESSWLNSLSPMLMTALSQARSRVEAGTGDAAILRWFGAAADADGRKAIGSILGQLRSNINVRSIPVGFMGLAARMQNQNARAWNIGAPQLSLGKPLAGPGVGGINTVELDLNFGRLPAYLPTIADGTIDASTGNQSKFETLVHELTHVLLGTKDVPLASGVTAYGAQNAAALAVESADKALQNAENWAIFIEACGRNKSS